MPVFLSFELTLTVVMMLSAMFRPFVFSGFVVTALLFLGACSADAPAPEAPAEVSETPAAPAETELVFGESFEFSSEPALDVDAILAEVREREDKEKTAPVQLTGEVVKVCQSKGCWLTLTASDGTEMRIRFKDYGFFVPKDLPGTQVALKGVAWKEVTSVATLRHYAEDEGADEQEINAITRPEIEYMFEASGVRVL